MHDSREHWLHTVLDTLDDHQSRVTAARHARWYVLRAVVVGAIIGLGSGWLIGWVLTQHPLLGWLVPLVSVTGVITGLSLRLVWRLRAVSWADRRKRTIL